jgi:hypothetical protein
LQERLGWRVKTVNLAMPAVNLAASFHVEIPAPPEMEVQIARLVFKPWEPPASEEEAGKRSGARGRREWWRTARAARPRLPGRS